MASESLEAFVRAVEEVSKLQHADPTPSGGSPHEPEVARVVGRASVVLLTSHFERYIYAVNEEATDFVNSSGASGTLLPEALRLIHSAGIVDVMFQVQWVNRAEKLREFMRSDGWLWQQGPGGILEHKRLLEWMKAPTPKNLIRYYRYWNINDIFEAITRTTHTKIDLQLKLQELVDKRNNIAHGDPNTEATRGDVRSYREATLKFCERSDRQLARSLGGLLTSARPW